MNARRLVVAILVIVIVGGGVAFAVNRDSSGEDIFLEGAAQTGIDPFTTVAVRQCADGYVAAPAGSNEGCVPTTTVTTAADTTTTALYGGSGSQKRCDPEALIAYLTTHTAKRTAWLQGLNEDPTLEWSGGHKVTEADLPAFIRELTPTFLTEDTRVTNHGYVNGKATPHQSVLQKGTAVLVDRTGVPRARCACGNPLGRPHKVRNPHYKGHCWDGCHDRPFCAPPGCSATTTSSSSTTSTTECGQSTSNGPAALKQQQTTTVVTRGVLEIPDPCASTTTEQSTSTTKGQKSGTTTTHLTTPSSITTTSTSTTIQITTTSTSTTSTTIRDPNCPPPGPADCKP